jgi:hypothetical protein
MKLGLVKILGSEVVWKKDPKKGLYIFDVALSNLFPDSDHGTTETPDPNIQIITKNRELLVEHDGPKFPTGQP